MWVRGLKPVDCYHVVRVVTSHPVWVRGLKLGMSASVPSRYMSHPVWVRGLKLCDCYHVVRVVTVAPRVGAWIETDDLQLSDDELFGRTPCGCVD